MDNLATLIEACTDAIAATEGRCSYCVGWWTAVLKSIARNVRDGSPLESEFFERHQPGHSDCHGPRCAWRTMPAKKLLVG